MYAIRSYYDTDHLAVLYFVQRLSRHQHQQILPGSVDIPELPALAFWCRYGSTVPKLVHEYADDSGIYLYYFVITSYSIHYTKLYDTLKLLMIFAILVMLLSGIERRVMAAGAARGIGTAQSSHNFSNESWLPVTKICVLCHIPLV